MYAYDTLLLLQMSSGYVEAAADVRIRVALVQYSFLKFYFQISDWFSFTKWG